MLGFLEPVCRQVCSDTYYNWFGQYFWPELLNNGFSLVEFFTELDTTGVIATGTMLLASAGGLYYCISRRNGQVHIEESATPLLTSDVPAISMEDAAQLLEQHKEETTRLEAQQAQRLQEAQLALEAQMQATKRNVKTETLVDIQALAQPATSVAHPKQHMPKQQILAAYFKTHLSEKMKYLNPSYKAEVEHDAFVDLGLPLDGIVPTDPAELRHYRSTMKGLGLNLNY
ncbi:MAG: hypothetical protein HYX61_10920 [Gammaproteobacteria bacterium]|jgi:hypothetical protein|nr:hypothetical protein [Gammaproteobacteria bacterium]